MKRNYYIFSSGRLRRKDNTVYFEPMPINDLEREKLETESEDEEILVEPESMEMNSATRVENGNGNNEQPKIPDRRKAMPIEDIESFYCFGEMNFNSHFFNYLSQKKIPLHLFNYFGFYSGSYYPREYLLSGNLLVHQVGLYKDCYKRLELAQELVRTACLNILKTLTYYENRLVDHSDGDLKTIMESIGLLQKDIASTKSVSELMGVEGRMREQYYNAWKNILKGEQEFEKRVKRPPDNLVNTMISFGNSLMYTTVLTEIYRTQLNPTVSFYHEPGERRFSLALDLSEVFKPILIDRMIFKLLNTEMLQEKHFEKKLNYCYLKEEGRKIVLKEYDERLKTTVKHKKLGRSVSYRHLIRLECYKLIKHLLGDKKFEGFKMWW